MMRHIVILVLFLTLSGCGEQELYSELSERQVNEMVAVLQNAGLSAEKSNLGKGVFSVSTSRRHFAAAVEQLRANGYPRDQFDNLGSVFKKEGFVSSPLEENARLIYALSQEISNTIASIDGVIIARVHLAVPEKSPLDDTIKPSSASVFIKHRRDIDLSGSVSQIKSLVVNGIEGLPYENVTIALFAMEPMVKKSLSQNRAHNGQPMFAESTLFWGALMISVVLLGGGFWLWQRHKQRRITAIAHVK